MTLIRRLVQVFLVLSIPALGSGEILSVCDVFRNLSLLNGKTISVRGTWGKGHTGEELDAEAACASPTIIDGWRFWDTIDLVPDKGKAAAARYYGERNRLLDHYRGASVKVVGVFVGTLETKQHFEIHIFPSGEQIPEAFRHYAARLRYIGVRDLHLVPTTDAENQETLERARNPIPKRIEEPGAAPELRAKP